MELKVINANNDDFWIHLTIKPPELVFPAHNAIFTVVLIPCMLFALYIFFYFFLEMRYIPLININMDVDIILSLGLILSFIFGLRWIQIWFKKFHIDNLFTFHLDKKQGVLFVSRENFSGKVFERYEIPLEYLKNLLIMHSNDGMAHGWSLSLVVLKSKRATIHPLFVVNDSALMDFYSVALAIHSGLKKLELLKLLRISDIFLRKIKEKTEKFRPELTSA